MDRDLAVQADPWKLEDAQRQRPKPEQFVGLACRCQADERDIGSLLSSGEFTNGLALSRPHRGQDLNNWRVIGRKKASAKRQKTTNERNHREMGESFLRRVWSWLRMNAGGVPNTCKSSGKVLTVCLIQRQDAAKAASNNQWWRQNHRWVSEFIKQDVRIHERRTAE